MFHFLLRRWRPTVFLIVALLMESSLGCASLILLHPSNDPRDTKGAVAHTIPFRGQKLEIWTKRTKACEGRQPLAYVLHFVGNGSRADDDVWAVAQMWDRWPVEVWSVNYPGYGGSTGYRSLSLIPPAALAAYDDLSATAAGPPPVGLANREISAQGLASSPAGRSPQVSLTGPDRVGPHRPIFLSSNSIGGCSAIYVAGQRDVAGLVIQDPPPLRRLLVEHYGWWNLYLLSSLVALDVPPDMNTPTTGPHAHAPACFLMADDDAVIPPFYHQVVVDAYGGQSTVINMPGCDHNSPIAGAPQEQARHWIDRRWHELFPETQPSK